MRLNPMEERARVCGWVEKSTREVRREFVVVGCDVG